MLVQLIRYFRQKFNTFFLKCNLNKLKFINFFHILNQNL
jgi:hypothetical protein